jgi:hypothetical protein
VSDLVVYGSATDPSTGGAVVATSSLAGGRYNAIAVTMPTGTVAAGDLNNVQLQVGATVVGNLIMIPTANTTFTNPSIEVSVPAAGAAISVNAVAGASGASAVYNALLVVKTAALDA